MPELLLIRGRIGGYSPDLARPEPGAREAAVALVLHKPRVNPLEILFIERAVREGDPWSGQMAFPGGRRDPRDSDALSKAVRETQEEVGLELEEPIGRLDDVQGTPRLLEHRLVISAFVFEAPDRNQRPTSPEVQSTVWIPVPHLLDPASAVNFQLEHGDYSGRFPGVRFKDYTIWGLTYRILRQFFKVLEHELPVPRS